MNTFDLVIVGADAAAIAAAAEAAREGLRVLVVIRSRRAQLVRRLRQSLRVAESPQRAVTFVTGAEVACVDGVNTVEAVVVRDLRTGRLRGFNAAALRRFSE
jgi:predicted oxidoreductase